ncbi:hypothetical protein M408DRAFT_170678 [Serendipita vermifera MAFF 305830]|uniref:Condensin complex subunit 1 C-terminal domain-containing protein n=1 Tax=Serendipita vermifera MAFF 305830 TaxID=933852 RepID=A0A0C2WLK6_SERVB|nr:hypothetical protein M408DRAFT_170678 [Serendipita vermifera MAFF 305830]
MKLLQSGKGNRDRDILRVAGKCIGTLIDHAELHPAMVAAIPFLFTLIREPRSQVRSVSTDIIHKLANHPEVAQKMATAAPSIIRLLGNSNKHVRLVAMETIDALLKHRELHPMTFFAYFR